eukprot:gene13580-biopygen7392
MKKAFTRDRKRVGYLDLRRRCRASSRAGLAALGRQDVGRRSGDARTDSSSRIGGVRCEGTNRRPRATLGGGGQPSTRLDSPGTLRHALLLRWVRIMSSCVCIEAVIATCAGDAGRGPRLRRGGAVTLLWSNFVAAGVSAEVAAEVAAGVAAAAATCPPRRAKQSENEGAPRLAVPVLPTPREMRPGISGGGRDNPPASGLGVGLKCILPLLCHGSMEPLDSSFAVGDQDQVHVARPEAGRAALARQRPPPPGSLPG